MRILCVVSRFPYPPIYGDQVRSYHFLRVLSRRHSITLVTPISKHVDNQSQRIVSQLCERLVFVKVPKWQAITHLSRFPFSPLPLQTLYFCPPAIQKQVRALLEEEPFDLIHIQLARMAPIANGLSSVPKVLDFIDALSLNMRHRAMLERWPIKWLFQLEAQRMARYEQKLVSSFDQQVISSLLDKEAIGSYKTLHVIPNGVNVEDFPYTENGREDNLIVFTGRLGYFFNADAAVYFATRIFPLILQQKRNVRFLIVGADPPPRVRQLSRLPGVKVIGYVPRIHDYLAKATVAIAPMQAGTGIQNKILEAMASGAPVVATLYALGGIEAIDGEHLLVAKDDKDMAEQVVRLLKDPGLRCHLSRNARWLVEEKYTWDRSVAMLEEVYRLAIERRKGR